MKQNQNLTKVLFVALAALVILSCSGVSVSLGGTATPIPTDPPIPPTLTPEPIAIETATAEATATSIPSPTLEPTAIPTFVQLPQQWNGTYTYPTSGGTQNVVLLIEKMKGTTFTGKMIWLAFGNSRGATLRMNGEYVSDFGDEVEQMKWKNLEDYNNQDKSGDWLKWTETEVIDGGNYTTNGWYYAHIRKDRTMVAVYFFNNTSTIADVGTFSFKLVTR